MKNKWKQKKTKTMQYTSEWETVCERRVKKKKKQLHECVYVMSMFLTRECDWVLLLVTRQGWSLSHEDVVGSDFISYESNYRITRSFSWFWENERSENSASKSGYHKVLFTTKVSVNILAAAVFFFLFFLFVFLLMGLIKYFCSPQDSWWILSAQLRGPVYFLGINKALVCNLYKRQIGLCKVSALPCLLQFVFAYLNYKFVHTCAYYIQIMFRSW